MNTFAAEQRSGFESVLTASDLDQKIPDGADLYGWLVGSWELEVKHYWVDVRGRGLKGQAHFSRVLQGRAVQDVWIIPAVDSAGPSSYGTTLRVWDAALKAWRVTWVNPVTGVRNELIGRRVGNDIVQIGSHADGTPIRWTFTEISDGSFVWKGEALNEDGQSWTLQGEFLAKRIR